MDGPRACREEEFDAVIDLINHTFRAGSDQNIRTDYPLIFNLSKLEYMRILKVDGVVVSHVPVAPRQVIARDDTFTIGIISPTITHPEYRKRGYATLCLRDCIRIMEENNWPVSVLWTQEATFPFYHHSGWEAVGCQGWTYGLEPGDQALFEAGSFEILPYDPDNARHLDAIIQIHDAEPYRIARSHAEYQALFALPKTSTLLAMHRGEVAAYLTVSAATNKPGLIEAGGHPAGLEVLLNRVLSARDQEIQALAHLTPSVLDQLVEAKKPGTRRPIEEADGVGFQMLRINNLELLLRQIEPYLREKSMGLHGDVCLVCSDTDQVLTLEFRSGEVGFSAARSAAPVVLSRRQLTQLIFGSHPDLEPLELGGDTGEILQQVFPYYFPIWELDHS